MSRPDDAAVVADLRRWLDRAVIGLNLCPFARAVVVRDQVRIAISPADNAAGVLEALRAELVRIDAADAALHDTTLLAAPCALADFLDFNACLGQAERLLRKGGYAGRLQLASFHPDYRFADAEADDPANCSNRAPYPVLHILRESSVARAVDAVADTDAIYQANQRTLRALGHAGWAALQVGPAGARHAA